MSAATARHIAVLHREIVRLGQDALAYPILAVTRGRQITALYAQIARLREGKP